jgi:hypothetical protein
VSHFKELTESGHGPAEATAQGELSKKTPLRHPLLEKVRPVHLNGMPWPGTQRPDQVHEVGNGQIRWEVTGSVEKRLTVIGLQKLRERAIGLVPHPLNAERVAFVVGAEQLVGLEIGSPGLGVVVGIPR